MESKKNLLLAAEIKRDVIREQISMLKEQFESQMNVIELLRNEVNEEELIKRRKQRSKIEREAEEREDRRLRIARATQKRLRGSGTTE